MNRSLPVLRSPLPLPCMTTTRRMLVPKEESQRTTKCVTGEAQDSSQDTEEVLRNCWVRMEKKVRTAPTNTSLLPPCKVCLEPAAGFHYGVNTCEACKGFFRRSLLRDKPYKCLGSGNCNIQAGKRHICPKCRHRRCLDVGMSKEAIKTGRYTHAKRTQDILEYQEMMGKSFDTYLSTAETAPVTNINKHSSNLSISSDTLESLTKNLSGDFPINVSQSLSSNPSNSLSQTMISGSLKSLPTEAEDGSTLHSMSSSPEGSAGISHSHATVSSEASLLDQPFELSAVNSPPSIPADLLPDLCKVKEVLSPLSPTSYSSHSPEKFSPWPAFGSPQYSDKSSPCSVMSLSQGTDTSGYDSAPGMEPCLSPAEVSMGEIDDAECARIVSHILQSHRNINMMPSDLLTAQELLDKQTACYETCRMKSELFGCTGLSKKEYLDFYCKTGLDVDNRQMLMGQHILPMLDQTIRKYIAFAKTIPGFSELSLKDQINLIKNNRCEFRMLSTFKYYNYDMKVMTLESGRTECIHVIAKIIDMENLLPRFECANAISKLNLTCNEMVLLKSLMVVTEATEDLEDPVSVNVIHWKMAQCLLWLLKQHRPDANRVFARIISLMCYIRNWSVGFYEWLKSNPLEHFAALQHNPLLAEWFSSM